MSEENRTLPNSRSISLEPDCSLSVVIPTFRRPEMLQALLLSLRDGSRVPDEVIVVDNDPLNSASPEPVEGLPVRVRHAGLGHSVAGARNAGWRESTSDLCVFIDDDNKVESDTIAELTRAFAPGDIGLAGPVIYAGDEGTIWCGGIRRSRWTGRTHLVLSGQSTVPDGPNWDTEDMPDAFAVPRTVLEDVNGFDEQRFPIHYEEADLGARIRGRGLRAIVARDSRIRHYGWVGLSSGGALVRAMANHGEVRTRQMSTSRIRYHVLHSRGLERLSIVGIFIPTWVAITCVTCMTTDAPVRVRLATVQAILAGAVTGYGELLRKGRPRL